MRKTSCWPMTSNPLRRNSCNNHPLAAHLVPWIPRVRLRKPLKETFRMCGIVGYIGPKKVVPVIIEGLRKLEYRGYDSAGIAVVDASGKLHLRRAPGKLRNLDEVIRESPIEGTYGI